MPVLQRPQIHFKHIKDGIFDHEGRLAELPFTPEAGEKFLRVEEVRYSNISNIPAYLHETFYDLSTAGKPSKLAVYERPVSGMFARLVPIDAEFPTHSNI